MTTLVLTCMLALGVIETPPPAVEPVRLIYDTDMGNDIDDALALGIIHNLQTRGECELLAVTCTKDHPLSAPFIDCLNTFYGRGDIPIGVVRDGVTKEPSRYTVLAEARDGDAFRYPHDLLSGEDAEDATSLLRRVLAAQPDGSVVIAQVGFSTNLARLLDSPADDISPLNGRDLVAKKVRVLSAMAGAYEPYNNKPHPEYNVVKDIPAAQKLTRDWPVPIVYSGFEIGIKTRIPMVSLKRDYGYVTPHILEEGYRYYNKEYHDQQTWDLTSVLWAVRPGRGYFSLSPKGNTTYDDKGLTSFEPDEKGLSQYLIVDEVQIARVSEVLGTLASEPPKK